jgi:probable F420-dependent oxidoreductase
MKAGVVFPQIEFGNDPQAIKDYAQAAEDLGYDYLLAYDHVLGAHPDREPKLTGPYTYEHPFHEPMVLFGFIAAVTKRIQLATGVIILPQRQTALVAKQAAELDVLSGGRLRLGVGLGWNYVEYEALGENFKTRGRRIEEQVNVLRKLWTEPLVKYQGEHFAINNAGLNPMPIQRPIPIWFGGFTDPAITRAARLADGWFTGGRRPDDESMRRHVELFHRTLDEAGRDRRTVGMAPWLSIQGLKPDGVKQRVDAWRVLGATEVALDTMRAGFKSPREHIDAIRSFRDVLDK